MSTPASGIVCRRATAEDYEAVLDINRNLYSGMDPVPGTFMASLEDSRMIMHVLEKDKRIVAFVKRVVVDDGETGVEENVRVHPDLQGQGLYALLSKFADEDCKNQFPRMKRVAWTSQNRPVSERLVKQNPNVHLVAVRPRVSFELSPDWLTALSSEPMSSQFLELQRSLDPDGLTRLLPPSEAVQMLSAIPNINSFTPQGHFIVNTRPYRARCRPNFEYMVPVNIGIWLPTNTNKTQLEDFLVGKLRVSRWLTEPTFSNDLLLLESDPHDFSKL